MLLGEISGSDTIIWYGKLFHDVRTCNKMTPLKNKNAYLHGKNETV